MRTVAHKGRLVLLSASNDVDPDVSFAGFPFEIEVLQRASDWQVTPAIALRTCSAEGLILYKLVAARHIDLHDVQSVISRMGARLGDGPEDRGTVTCFRDGLAPAPYLVAGRTPLVRLCCGLVIWGVRSGRSGSPALRRSAPRMPTRQAERLCHSSSNRSRVTNDFWVPTLVVDSAT